MKKIYKYKIELVESQPIMLPCGYVILSVHTQGNDICIWCLIDPYQNEFEKAIIEIFGTGQEVTGLDEDDFIGTILLEKDSLVFHVFSEKSKAV